MTMVLTPEQYLALSAIASIDLGSDVGSRIADIRDNQYVGVNFANSQYYALSAFDDWTLLDQTPSSSSGFSSSVFQSPSTTTPPSQLIFSFRGTANPSTGDLYGFLKDLDDNGFIASGTAVPIQFLEAYSFVKETIEALH